MNRGFP